VQNLLKPVAIVRVKHLDQILHDLPQSQLADQHRRKLLLGIVDKIGLWIVECFLRLHFAINVFSDIFNISAQLLVKMRAKDVRTLTHFLAVVYSSLYVILFFLLAYKELLGTYFVFFDSVGFLVPTLLVLCNDKEKAARYAAMTVAAASGLLNLICLIMITVDWVLHGSNYLGMQNITGLFWAALFVVIGQAIFLLLSIFSVYLLTQMTFPSKPKKT